MTVCLSQDIDFYSYVYHKYLIFIILNVITSFFNTHQVKGNDDQGRRLHKELIASRIVYSESHYDSDLFCISAVVAVILLKRRKTLINQSINQSISF